ncbi:hypothetical protein Micbo1qcDRAFT_161611 [Microdochium bolleyi]|uniref:Zn(2)-C6 fungal-type domain-containing protein n=1 Tax=Microdochium bolleyi TaxID=196109 RepID=A0A136J3D3_9PEZI|nr:hypothetical protein Micbo1qcDRAFT_161611 [Microdochium bolleyi]
MPCTACSIHNRVCWMALNRPRCLECVCRGAKCDGLFAGLQISKNLAKQESIRDQEEKAEDDLLRFQAEIVAA